MNCMIILIIAVVTLALVVPFVYDGKKTTHSTKKVIEKSSRKILKG